MKIFNTVQDLKEARLTAGQLTETKGYHSAGDGGQARYLIQTSAEFGGTPDEYGNHTLANGNVAVLQVEGAVNVKQFGAVGDGVADDSVPLSFATSVVDSFLIDPLPNSFPALKNETYIQKALDGNFLSVFNENNHIVKNKVLQVNRTGGDVTGGHAIAEKDSSFCNYENLYVSGIDGTGFGLLSYTTSGVLNKGNLYKDLTFISPIMSENLSLTQGGLLLAGNKFSRCSNIYGENLGQFGTLEFKNDSHDNSVSQVIGNRDANTVYFGQDNLGTTPNNVVVGVNSYNALYSAINLGLASNNIILAVNANNNLKEAVQPHGVTIGGGKNNYVDALHLKDYETAEGKIAYPIRFRNDSSHNYIGCTHDADTSSLRVSEVTASSNVVELKNSSTIRSLLQNTQRPLGGTSGAEQHNGTVGSDVTYAPFLGEWIGSMSGRFLWMPSYLGLPSLFSSDRFVQAAAGGIRTVVASNGETGTKYVSGVGTGNLKYSNIYLDTTANGLRVQLGTSATNINHSPSFIEFTTTALSLGQDATVSFGTPSNRGDTAYFSTGAINTSDSREKTFLSIEESERLAALEIKANLRKFQFNDSVKEKGEEEARLHFGASAQEVGTILAKHGLNPNNYAFYCYDEWDEVVDEKGVAVKEAGNRYGIRYEELLCFIMAAL